MKSLHVLKHHVIKAYGSSRGMDLCIINLGSKFIWSDSRSSRFIPAEKVPGTRCKRGLAGTTSGLDSGEKQKISAPTGNRTEISCSSTPYPSHHVNYAAAMNDIQINCLEHSSIPTNSTAVYRLSNLPTSYDKNLSRVSKFNFQFSIYT